jgi:hypothetical protein
VQQTLKKCICFKICGALAYDLANHLKYTQKS